MVLTIAMAISLSSVGSAKKSITQKGDSGAQPSSAKTSKSPAKKNPALPPPAGKTAIFFVDGGVRHDLGTFVQKETVGRASITDETTDIYALGPLFHLGLLFPVANRVRVGGAFGYGFNYTITERQEGPNTEDPNRTQLGQLITADLRLEWNPLLGGPFSLIVAPIATLTAIAAGGELKDTTASLEQSHNVWKGPRLGWSAGAEAGLRYMFKPWLSFKVAAGYAYTMQSLLHATRQGDAADSKRVWRVSASRITGLCGVEAHF